MNKARMLLVIVLNVSCSGNDGTPGPRNDDHQPIDGMMYIPAGHVTVWRG